MHRRTAIQLLATSTTSLALPNTIFGFMSKSLSHTLDMFHSGVEVLQHLKDTPQIQTISVSSQLRALGLSAVSATSLVSSALFRAYVDENSYAFVSCLQQQYGDADERFLYKLVTDKLLQEFAVSRAGGNDRIVVPTKELFMELVSRFSWNELKQFAQLHGLDIGKTKEKLLSKNDYMFTPGTTAFHKYGYQFVPYNVVYQSLLEYKSVDIVSSYQGALEDGSSMHDFRTGLEIKQKTHNTLCVFLSKFQEFAKQYGGARVVLRGAREFGHIYDRYFDHSKEYFGKPLSTMPDKARYDSHEFGNCVDFRMSGRDGIIFYEYLRLHTQDKRIRPGNRQIFVDGDCSFVFMYHGGEPMAGHFHTWMGS